MSKAVDDDYSHTHTCGTYHEIWDSLNSQQRGSKWLLKHISNLNKSIFPVLEMALASLPCFLLRNHKKFNQQQPGSFCKSAVKLWKALVMISAAQLLPSCIGPNSTKTLLEPSEQRHPNSSKPCIFPRTFCRQLLRRNLAEFSWLRFYNSLCCVCALRGEGGAGGLWGMDLTTWLKWIQYILDNS